MLLVRGAAKGLADERRIEAPITWLNDLLRTPGGRGAAAGRHLGGRRRSRWSSPVMLRYTRFGRHLFAIGSNERTARLCGVAIDADARSRSTRCRRRWPGWPGVLQFSKLSVGDPTVAVGLELDVIAAVIIGGGSLPGGRGTRRRHDRRRGDHDDHPDRLLAEGAGRTGCSRSSPAPSSSSRSRSIACAVDPGEAPESRLRARHRERPARNDMIIGPRDPRSSLSDVAHAATGPTRSTWIPTTPRPTSSCRPTAASRGTASRSRSAAATKSAPRRSTPSATRRRPRRRRHHRRLRRLLALARVRLAAAMARAREGRHPPLAGRHRQRGLGSLRQGRAASRCGSCSPT